MKASGIGLKGHKDLYFHWKASTEYVISKKIVVSFFSLSDIYGFCILFNRKMKVDMKNWHVG